MKKILAADLFCGAGGTSSGFIAACRERGLDFELIAINHWNVAIQTHGVNHPGVRHFCENLDNIKPKELVPTGRLNLLCASPPCQHHSRARGGKPVNDQMRSSAWRILDWATDLYIDSILMENVKEWEEWGPLGVDGRPLKSQKGQTFQAFLAGLRGLGYRVEYRTLNAADYGDPTTRERLFVIARRGNKPIVWPEPTHRPRGGGKQMELLGQHKTWRAAREIIDWNIPGKSIFERKKPLARSTVERIAAGLTKFGGANAEPFLVILRNHMASRSIDDPVPTVTANGRHIGVCEPFVVEMRNGKTANSLDDPLSTVTTKGAHHALIEPFVLGQQSGSVARSVDRPLPTVAGGGAIALIEPFLVTANHGTDARSADGTGHGCRAKSLNDPIPTLTGSNSYGLVEPFVVPMNRTKDRSRSVEDPLRTVTATSNDMGLVEPFIIPFFGEAERQKPRSHSIDDPLPAVTSHGAGALVEPFIVPQFSKGAARSVDRPLGTVTTTSRGIGLVEPFIITAGGPEGQGRSARSIEDPMATVLTDPHQALVEPFVVPTNHGESDRRSFGIDNPMPTVTSVDAWGLIEPGPKLDIRFRMLQPRELARAQGFPDDYSFSGNREQIVKQIGNAVPVGLAKALCAELLDSALPAKKEAVA